MPRRAWGRGKGVVGGYKENGRDTATSPVALNNAARMGKERPSSALNGRRGCVPLCATEPKYETKPLLASPGMQGPDLHYWRVEKVPQVLAKGLQGARVTSR